jgi:putative MATE family efflux protein
MISTSNITDFFKLLKQAVSDTTQDFTQVQIKKAIFLLAVPMVLEMIMESLFAVVDIFFVGKLGEHAIATVGLTEAAVMIVYSVGVGLSMAATALISRRIGEKQYTKAGNAAFQLLVVGFVISLFLGVGGYNYAREILSLMGGDEVVIEKGTPFAKIIFAGNTAIMLLFLINGAFRGAGQAQIAMRTLWISNGINIILVPVLIYGIGDFSGYGLQGAAWATTTGRSIGVIYQLYNLLNGKHQLVIRRQNIRLSLKVLTRIIVIAAGGMGQFFIDSAAWIVLTRIIAEFGSTTVAAFTITFRVLIFSLMPAWGLSGAAATLVGQNLGAHKIKRAEISTLLTARYNVIFLAAVTLIYLITGNLIAEMFTDIPEVSIITGKALRIIALGYVFFAIGMVMIQAFNGAGDTKTPAFINIGVLWCLEIPLALLLAFVAGLGATGVFIAIALCHSLHAMVSLYLFRKGNWKKVKV